MEEGDGILLTFLEGLEIVLEAKGDSRLRAAQRMLVGKVMTVKVAQLLGEIVTIESPFLGDTLLRSFLRVRVMIDIRKPLITGFWLPRKHLPRAWISIRYQRLQGFCFTCGVLGHDFKKCNKEKVMALHDTSQPRYGLFLGVPPAKSMAAIAVENIRRVRKVNGEDKEPHGGDHTGDKSYVSPTNCRNDMAASNPLPLPRPAEDATTRQALTPA
ncbi:Zinc knuckle CX2CX4HX4C [Sesbania bispinosa]|nr:Zinc knuckle CX2CX4HX4C [Sesbania bispinosa]